MNSMILNKMFAQNYWMIFCITVAVIIHGCDSDSIQKEGGKASIGSSKNQLIESQQSLDCELTTGPPSYDRAVSCIGLAKLRGDTELSLKGYGLDKIPLELFDLPRLKRLNLEQNKLSELPDLFDRFHHLEMLNLRKNQILSIPESLMKLKKLRRLHLDDNRITEFNLVPDSFPALEQLTLTNNGIKHIGPGIGSLGNLWHLALEENLLWTLPKEIGNLAPIIFAGKYNITSGGMDAFRSEKFKQVYELATPYAEAGDFRAQALLGDLFTYDSEKNEYYNIEKGIELYRKAANSSGNAKLQFNLAITLRNAKIDYSGRKKSNAAKEAFKWLLASAEQGHAFAQMEVAKAYQFNLGVERDYVKAYKWYKLASNRFNAKPIIVKGMDISDKGLAGDFMTGLTRNKIITEKEKEYALNMAEQWENDHPNAYKTWPNWLYQK